MENKKIGAWGTIGNVVSNPSVNHEGKVLRPTVFIHEVETKEVGQDGVRGNSWLSILINKCYRYNIAYRPAREDEKPSYMQGLDYLIQYVEEELLVEFKDDGSTYVDPSLFNEDSTVTMPYEECTRLVAFLCRNIAAMTPFMAFLMSCPIKKKHDPHKVMLGLLRLIEDPSRFSVIETIAKSSNGKITPVGIERATEAIVNINYGEGKKKAIIAQAVIDELNKQKLGELIPIVQDQVINEIMTLQDVDAFIDLAKALIKISKISAKETSKTIVSPSELCSSFLPNKNEITEKRISLLDTLEVATNSFFTCYELSKSEYYGFTKFSYLIRQYLATREMLPAHKKGESKKAFKTDNIARFHTITSINASIMKERRPEEFANAINRLRKLTSNGERFVIRPPKDEDELFYVGQRYNNCLPTYRDKIINGSIVLFLFDLENGDDCPVAVFEINSRLDFIQIKTFNDEDLPAGPLMEVIKEWRVSKRYLITDGRTVYRDADEEKTEVDSQPIQLAMSV